MEIKIMVITVISFDSLNNLKFLRIMTISFLFSHFTLTDAFPHFKTVMALKVSRP